MKKSILLAILFLTFATLSCHKPVGTPGSAGAMYRGVVINNICCQIVIQTLGTDNLGQSWNDMGVHYDHVFKVANPCQFGNHEPFDTIKFKIVPAQAQNCACCMVYVNTPDTAYSVQVVN